MKKISLLILVLNLGLTNIHSQSKSYVLATYTYSTNNRIQNIEPLANYLSSKTGLTIKAVSYPTVQALIRAINNDSVDFAMMNTSGYLVLQRNYPGKVLPLVNLDMGNSLLTNYGGCLIAGKQIGVTSLASLRTTNKKALALVNSSSTSGNLVPRLLLNAKNIPDAEETFSVRYAGTHKQVVEDVMLGKADVGGCGCAEVDNARKQLAFDEKAVIIDSFNDIPLGPIVFNNQTERRVVNRISALLLKLHQDNSTVFTNFCKGWSEFKEAKQFKKVADKDYDNFRKLFGTNTQLWKLIE